MRNGKPVTLLLESRTVARSSIRPENLVDMDWASDEMLEAIFSIGDQSSDLLCEINSQLRLNRIARSRRNDARHRKSSYLRLACSDGNVVSARDQAEALDAECLAVLTALRSLIGRY